MGGQRKRDIERGGGREKRDIGRGRERRGGGVRKKLNIEREKGEREEGGGGRKKEG